MVYICLEHRLWFDFCFGDRITRLYMPRLVLTIAFVLISLGMAAQPSATMVRNINQAIERGSSRQMATYFGPHVELNLPGSEGTFSKSQGEVIMRDFFSRNNPVEYKINYQGAFSDDSVYIIGTLRTQGGGTFRTYLIIKQVSRTYFLHQIQFDPR